MKGDLTPCSSGLLCCSFVFISDWLKHTYFQFYFFIYLSHTSISAFIIYSIILRDDDSLSVKITTWLFVMTLSSLWLTSIFSPLSTLPFILSFVSCFPVWFLTMLIQNMSIPPRVPYVSIPFSRDLMGSSMFSIWTYMKYYFYIYHTLHHMAVKLSFFECQFSLFMMHTPNKWKAPFPSGSETFRRDNHLLHFCQDFWGQNHFEHEYLNLTFVHPICHHHFSLLDSCDSNHAPLSRCPSPPLGPLCSSLSPSFSLFLSLRREMMYCGWDRE